MRPCGPNPDSSESNPIFATPSAGDGWPLNADRLVYDKGAHMASRLHKRAEDLLDYCIDLRLFLEPGETVQSASAQFSPLTTPAFAVPKLEFGRLNVTVWADGGKNGQSYQISVFIITSGGRQKLFRFFISTRGDAPTHVVAPGESGPAAVCAGLGPNLVLSTDSVTFPPTIVGQISAPVSVTVTNAGVEPLVINEILVSDDFLIESDSPGTVPPGGSFTMSIRFAPSIVGTIGGFVLIKGDSTADVTMIAQAV